MAVNGKAVTNADVAVFALAQLGGALKKVHSEEIAAKAFDLAPDKFSWRLRLYRDRGWPDKELVRAALVNAQTKEYGHLVQGAYNTDLSKDGWRLTAAGSQWLAKNEQRIADALSIREPSIPKRDAKRFCKKLKGDALFRVFVQSGDLESASQYEFTDMLECSPDAPKELIRMKFDRLLATAHAVKDDQLLRFLKDCQVCFSDVLGTSTAHNVR